MTPSGPRPSSVSGWVWAVALVVVWPIACSDEPAPAPTLRCQVAQTLTDSIALSEASGAVWVESPLGEGWLVVADQGHEGEAVLVAKGTLLTQSYDLPLDPGAGDDLEGLALAPDGRLVGLTSAGYLRQWTLAAGGIQLDQLAQPITEETDWLCAPQDSNCGANFEGLCLDPAPVGSACAGFAVSKEKGKLVCVVAAGAEYMLDTSRKIKVTGDDQLSGCDYELEPPHRLVVAGNDESFGALWEILHHGDTESALAVVLPVTGAPNQEAIAFGPDGALISFGDEQILTGEGSPVVGFSCE